MKRVRRGVVFIILTFGIILCAGWLLGYIYRDEVVAASTTALNQHLQTEIHPGAIDISFIQHFPYVSLVLEDTWALEAWDKPNRDTLFAVERLYFQFDLLEAIKGNYTLKAISLKAGFLRLKNDRAGLPNYRIWKSNGAAANELALTLEQVELKDIDFHLEQAAQKENFDLYISNLRASGTWFGDNTTINLKGDANVRDIAFNEVHYLRNRKLNLDAQLDFKQNFGVLTVKRGAVGIDGFLNAQIEGEVSADYLSFAFKATDIPLTSFRTIIPSKYTARLAHLKMEGKLDLAVSISRKTRVETPLVVTSFKLANASFLDAANGVELKKATLHGAYTNGEKRNAASSKLTIDTAHAEALGGFIELNGELTNFENPIINYNLSGDFALEALHLLFRNDSATQFLGNVDFDGNGRLALKRLDASDSLSVLDHTFTGALSFENASWSNPNARADVKHLTGAFKCTENHISTDGVEFEMLNSLCYYRGRITRPFASWTALHPLKVRGQLGIESLSVDQLMAALNTNPSEGGWPDHMDISLTVAADTVTYLKHTLRRVSTDFSLLQTGLRLNNTYFNYASGKCKGDMYYQPTTSDKNMQLVLDFNGVDIAQVFNQFNSFGQETLTEKHLAGKVSGSFYGKLPLTSGGALIADEVYAKGKVKITNGALIEFEPLVDVVRELNNERLGRLIKLDALEKRVNHIEFDELANTFELKNKQLAFPKMDVRSSAMNIHLAGKHGIEGDIDYNLDFNLREALRKPGKKANEFGYIKDDNTGNLTLFLRVTGTMDKPEVRFDRKSAVSFGINQVKSEIKKAKGILKKEFGLFAKDTSVIIPSEKQETLDYEMDFGELEQADTNKTKVKPQPNEKESKWKQLFKTRPAKRSKFESWEFENDDF